MRAVVIRDQEHESSLVAQLKKMKMAGEMGTFIKAAAVRTAVGEWYENVCVC